MHAMFGKMKPQGRGREYTKLTSHTSLDPEMKRPRYLTACEERRIGVKKVPWLSFPDGV